MGVYAGEILKADPPVTHQHPMRMLARLLPNQGHVRLKIQGSHSQDSSSKWGSGRDMPIMVLDGDTHGRIQSLGLEGCTFVPMIVIYCSEPVACCNIIYAYLIQLLHI